MNTASATCSSFFRPLGLPRGDYYTEIAARLSRNHRGGGFGGSSMSASPQPLWWLKRLLKDRPAGVALFCENKNSPLPRRSSKELS
jgi:hypothetical protein